MGQRHADDVRYGRRQGENEGTVAPTPASGITPETESPALSSRPGRNSCCYQKRCPGGSHASSLSFSPAGMRMSIAV